MRILLLSSLFAYNLFALEVGDTIRVKASSHPYTGQTGTVVKIEHGGNTTQAKIDFDGDGVKDGQVIVDYAYTYEVITDSDPDPDTDPDESSFYMEVSGNGFYVAPNIYVGTPTDSSTVTQDEDGHIVTTPNTGTDNDPTTGTTPTTPGDNNGTFSTVLTPNYSLQVDQDNDVPTLLAILAKLDTLDQDDDNYLLQQILDELKSQNVNDTGLDPTNVDFANITFDKQTTNILPGNINPLDSVTPSGSMPNLSISVPSLSGPTSVSIDLTDSKYDNLFLVAKAGLTAVFVFASIRFTAWSSGTLLSS